MKAGVKLAKKTMAKRNQCYLTQGQIYKRKLHRLYTYRGKRNFISYGHRAAKIMESTKIRKQLKPLWKRFIKEIKD